jgi:NAD(P)-dependent dehydrogenase (short-subunit alcohol dehydrogenase family)
LPSGVVVKTALVVGSSRGIGLAFVRQLLDQPSVETVFAGCRKPQTTQDLLRLKEQYPARLQPLPMDVTDADSLQQAAGAIAQQVPRLDLLINCAGVLHNPLGLQPEKRLADVRAVNLEQSFRVNALGAILLAQVFEPLLSQASPAIFASLSARVGSITDNQLGGWYAYRAAKAAQNMLLKTVSLEWARKRRPIICVALHPGTTDTELSKPFQRNVSQETLFSTDRTVRQLLTILNGLTLADSGRFLAWDGSEIPW